MINKIRTEHIGREACIYIRQSTSGQVIHHRESQRLQYGLVERAKEQRNWVGVKNVYE
ncbi:MAG: hypothetical protein JRJ27_21185 [Deltaproteobacteria bacterium]|nr:hypothetical protein [Deltaproteobacteria bacterium]